MSLVVQYSHDEFMKAVEYLVPFCRNDVNTARNELVVFITNVIENSIKSEGGRSSVNLPSFGHSEILKRFADKSELRVCFLCKYSCCIVRFLIPIQKIQILDFNLSSLIQKQIEQIDKELPIQEIIE